MRTKLAATGRGLAKYVKRLATGLGAVGLVLALIIAADAILFNSEDDGSVDVDPG